MADNETLDTELNNPDFQYVLKALLAVYQPILEQQLNLTRDPAELQRQAEAISSRTCAQEFEEAYSMFGKFLNEDTATAAVAFSGKRSSRPG